MKSFHKLLFALIAFTISNTTFSQDDPYIWLEEVESDSSMDWVLEQNKLTKDKITGTDEFDQLFNKYKAVYSDKDKITYPNLVGNTVYNFWQDEIHVRGIWRTMSKNDYDNNKNEWKTILDLDKLSADEDKKWVFQGATFLKPENKRCLLALSDGGTDKNEIREFDLEKMEFIKDGFYLPPSKGSYGWVSKDELIISRDFGEGSLTTSGYPRIVKKLKRGADLADAELIYEGPETFIGIWGYSQFVDGEYMAAVVASETTFKRTTHYIFNDELVEIAIPNDANISDFYKGNIILTLQSDWEVNDMNFPIGSIVSVNFKELVAGIIKPVSMFEPDSRSSVNGVAACKDFVLINYYKNVQSYVAQLVFKNGQWIKTDFAAPEFGSISIVDYDIEKTGFYYVYSNFITPPTIYFSNGINSTIIKKQKERFNAEGVVVKYHESKSKDGTLIPYFIVHKDDIKLDGSNPTLVYAYGGFNISQRPSYKTDPGVGWIEEGNVYVVACIRGGGEFGPSWHQAALKEKRQNAYDDFYSVCEDLIEKKVTSQPHLGAFGWSNGGLMAGVVATQRPDLFNAVIIGAPLLDMKRFSHMLAGASWMGEYGDPDTDDWEFIKKYSPYHNVHKDKTYPEVLFMTSTKDDRVHPAHARKMAARMLEQGHPLFYYETVEGGHGASSTIDQSAFNSALMYAYLHHKLK
ncbi:MAG: prolyl oligopeptidase family serine peptidase [Crocinitomix sp.]|nr:prolyl oligopeptidase family serine peptidase [Crocinitomix sp.]